MFKYLHSPASTVWRVEDFIIENWKVKGQSQTNGVRWREFDHSDVASSFVCYQTVLCRLLPVVACGELCQVPVVISLPEQREQQRQTDLCCHKSASQTYITDPRQWWGKRTNVSTDQQRWTRCQLQPNINKPMTLNRALNIKTVSRQRAVASHCLSKHLFGWHLNISLNWYTSFLYCFKSFWSIIYQMQKLPSLHCCF